MGTHILIILVMGLYYAVCGWRAPLALLIVTAAMHLITLIILHILGFKDPGSIPKIFGEYER